MDHFGKHADAPQSEDSWTSSVCVSVCWGEGGLGETEVGSLWEGILVESIIFSCITSQSQKVSSSELIPGIFHCSMKVHNVEIHMYMPEYQFGDSKWSLFFPRAHGVWDKSQMLSFFRNFAVWWAKQRNWLEFWGKPIVYPLIIKQNTSGRVSSVPSWKGLQELWQLEFVVVCPLRSFVFL